MTVLPAVALLSLAFVCAAEQRFPNMAGESSLPRGPGLAERFKADLGIGSAPAVIFADDFESGELGARWDEKGSTHTFRNASSHVVSVRKYSKTRRTRNTIARL